MEDLCSKNRQDGKKVFQFSTKMGLFVILLDVTKTKSHWPLALSCDQRKSTTQVFFFRSLTAMFVSRCFCFWCYCCCLSQHIFAVCEKMVNISYILWGGGGKAKDPCEYLRASQHCVSFCEHRLWYAS